MIQVLTASALALCTAAVVAAQSDSDSSLKGTDILNFALNLECLEAEFYSCASTGQGLSAEDRGYASAADMPASAATIGCKQATLTAFDQTDNGSMTFGAKELAKELADDEIAHVRFLREALGEDAIKCPKMDISGEADGAFHLAALAAFNETTLTPTFDPYANDLFFLHGAFIFEDVGVTAYNGAVPAGKALLTANVLQAVASILGVEAYHSGIVRSRLQLANRDTAPVAAYELNVATIVGAISDLRDSVAGDDDTDQGIVTGDASNLVPNLVPTNNNGLAYARSIPDVLQIVYLGGDVKGGFFPDGVNGAFNNLSGADIDGLLSTIKDMPDSDSTDSTDPNAATGLLAGVVAGVAALAALL